MISAPQCLYKLDQKLNKLSTFSNQEIPVEDKLIALNEAQIESVLNKIDQNNLYRIGFDGFRKRYEDLQILVQPHEKLPLTPTEIQTKFTSDLSKLQKKYLLYATIYIVADKEGCKPNRTLDVNIIKHSDLPLKLRDKNTQPSFEYQETVGTISSNLLEIYTDTTFTPTASYISYLTYPTPFDIEGYIKLDGEDSTDSNSNLPDYMENEIISIATRILAGSTANQEALQNAILTQSKND